MMVEMWMRKREMGEEDENDMEDISGYEKAGLHLARVDKTLYQCSYTPDYDSYLTDVVRCIDSHPKASKDPVPSDDFPHLLSSHLSLCCPQL